LVVPEVAAGVASSVTTRREPAPLSMLHACGAAVWPVASGTRLQLPPPSFDRNSPLSVAANKVDGLDGDTRIWLIVVESPRYTGVDHVAPLSVDFTNPMPVPSKGSPKPR
jgi:hypothetical protein